MNKIYFERTEKMLTSALTMEEIGITHNFVFEVLLKCNTLALDGRDTWPPVSYIIHLSAQVLRDTIELAYVRSLSYRPALSQKVKASGFVHTSSFSG